MFHYKSTRWLKKRKHILKRDKYLCQEAKRYGRREQANTVHHIYPAEEYPQYAWSDWNLISLSEEAHNAMHDRVSHCLTRQGENLKRRVSPPL